jgi:cysteine desulfurase
MKRPVYMDHHATTPVLPEVLDAMLPWFAERFGNPSSVTHVYGKEASDGVEVARRGVADLIGAPSSTIVFTSGATESVNLALRGAVNGAREGLRRIVTCVVEHEAVLGTCASLESEGWEIERLGVDADGRVEPAAVERALERPASMVSIQIGTLQPMRRIAEIARASGALVHSDAAQAVGRIPVDVDSLGVDLLSFSSHKMYGPKGAGALFVRKGVRVQAQMTGGGHEKKRRSGTLNVPALVGFGAAARIAARDMDAEASRLAELRDLMWEGIRSSIDHVKLNGHPTDRLPGNLNVTFRFVEGEALLVALRDVAALSTGSACSSGAIEGSYVIRALGADDDDAQSSLRFGLGRCNSEEDVRHVVERLAPAVARLRALSPRFEAVSHGAAGGGRSAAS